MIIFGLFIGYLLILFYIIARSESSWKSSNPDKTDRKVYHYFNMWVTGFNIMLAYGAYQASLIQDNPEAKDGFLILLVLFGIFSVLYQVGIALRFIWGIGEKVINYFVERD